MQSRHSLNAFRLLIALIVAGSLANSNVWAEQNWPEWRGRGGQGVSTAKDLPLNWSETDNVAWKTNVPGLGWSTPVISDGVVWVTTAVDRVASKEATAARKKQTNNSQPLRFSEFVSMRAVAIDLKTGEVLKNIEVLNQKDPQFIHHLNSYATPTPILEGEKLYCHFGPTGIACLNTKSGKVEWANRTLVVKHENGPGSSPILWGDLLIIHCDGIDKQYIVAINKNTGKTEWKTERTGKLNANPQLRKSYATALVVEVDGQAQIVSPAADWVYGYEPATGKELWKLNYGELGFSNAPRPVAGNGFVYICTGYMKSKLLAIKPGAANRAASIEWTYTKQVPAVSSPLLLDGEIYFGSDRGIATCLDAKSGKELWTKRIGSQFWASPIASEGRIYFLDKKGATTILEAGRKFRQLAVNQLNGTLFAAPAAVDGSLVLRTEKAIYHLK